MMSIIEEYKNQAHWRNWKSYFKPLPISKEDIVLDIGCSLGVMTKNLANEASQIIGVDNNPKLLSQARYHNSLKKIHYVLTDARSLNKKKLPIVDGIWSSFLPAYFPNFDPVLSHWLEFLKPKGWIAIVEINDLFGHDPLSNRTHDIFEDYYSRQITKNLYDFKMGSKLNSLLKNHDLSILHEENKDDPEFTFNGAAKPEIYLAWKARFKRMFLLKEFLGDNTYNSISEEFLSCILQNAFPD